MDEITQDELRELLLQDIAEGRIRPNHAQDDLMAYATEYVVGGGNVGTDQYWCVDKSVVISIVREMTKKIKREE